MRFRRSFPVLSLLALLVIHAASSIAHAQNGPDIFVTPVPNMPFSSLVQVERSLVQPNGTVVLTKTTRALSRDHLGRIYNERRALLPPAATQLPALLSVHLYDPQTRTSTMLDPRSKTFWTFLVNRPPSTLPPTLLEVTPTGSSVPQSEFTKEEDLGTQTIAGEKAHGIRETQTIPSEAGGSGKPIVVTDEYWYADNLRINVMIKHSDPRTGSVTMTTTAIERTEPDAALFQVPESYTQRRPARQEAP